jgi:teichuronic acid biosynthesis glycosyltransferase TuaC
MPVQHECLSYLPAIDGMSAVSRTQTSRPCSMIRTMSTDAAMLRPHQYWAKRMLECFENRQLVTWEHRDRDARLLMITNVWPHRDRPALGSFVQGTVEGVRNQGIACDVLFIRGYRGPAAYLAGALASVVLPFAYPHKYLLVHCHGGETALAARFFLGAPVLASYLGTDILGAQVGGSLGFRIKCWLRSAVLRRHASLMSATTTKSVEMESLLTPSARSRNAVVPDGVDRERFRPGDRDLACTQLGWSSDRANILFAGRVEAVEKRLWLAEQAVALARSQVPDIELQVVGGVSPSKMPLYYVAADCLLHTSVSEGSSNVVKEALACNLPVVATPAGDVGDLLMGLEACEMCEADASALATALVTILQAHRPSSGREHTEHLSIESIAKKTVERYRALGFLCDLVGPAVVT